MAQRDEGLDKLEAFIGSAAEARAVLQRETGTLAEAEEEMDALEQRFDHEMKNLGSTAEAFDARYGPYYELFNGFLIGSMVAIAFSAGFGVGLAYGHHTRPLLIATAKLLEALYEAFPYARQAAIEELEREEAAVAEAFAGLQAAAHALGTDVAPQAASVAAHLAGVRAQLDVHLEVRS